MISSIFGCKAHGRLICTVWVWALLISISACGGGGSTGESTPVTPPSPVVVVAPVISLQPLSQTVSAGQTVTFTVTASGDAPLTYQWRRNDVDVVGANQASYSFLATAADQGSAWAVKVSNAGGASLSSAASLSVTAPAKAWQLTLVAGDVGGPGNLNGFRTEARFGSLGAIAADAAGNVFVAENLANANSYGIRRISAAGQVNYLAGSTGVFAYSLATDAAGNLYASDNSHHVIRKFAADGSMQIVAGAIDSGGYVDSTDPFKARFLYPRGLTVDSGGNIYVADAGNDVVRKISPNGTVTTILKTVRPTHLALDGLGNLYIGPEHTEDKLLKLAPNGQLVSPGVDVHPSEIYVDRSGNVYLSSDNSTHTAQVFHRISTSGQISTLADSTLLGAYDGSGNVYRIVYGDRVGYAVSKFNPIGGLVEWAGKVVSGSLYEALPVVNNAGIHSAWCTNRSTVAPLIEGGYTGYGNDGIQRWYRDSDCTLLITYAKNHVYLGATLSTGCVAFRYPECYYYGSVNKLDRTGKLTRVVGSQGGANNATYTYADGPATQATIAPGASWVVDEADFLYLLGNGSVKVVSPSFQMTTFTKLPGDTSGSGSLILDSAGRLLYVGGTGIWHLRASQEPLLLVGHPTQAGLINGPALTARFMGSLSILAMDAKGNIYVADNARQLIRKIATDGSVTTMAEVSGGIPSDFAADAVGNLYFSDWYNHVIRKIGTDGKVTTLAGVVGSQGNRLGDLPGSLDGPSGLAFDAQGNLVFQSGSAIVKLTLPK